MGPAGQRRRPGFRRRWPAVSRTTLPDHRYGNAPILCRQIRAGFTPAPTRDGQAVGTIVHRAVVRADLHPPHQGAHLLRHSLATRLLREGASLVEIGALLRHQNLDTTRIYAKVDERALRRLAPPWPGGAQ